MARVFISHSHSDWRLAERLHEQLESMSGRALQVHRSSEAGAIKSGENWRDWIDEKVLNCDVAIVLLTPGSLRGRWVLWEAGAVAGVQYERTSNRHDLASDDRDNRRVRVLQFGLEGADLGPFGSSQARDGLVPDQMEAFFREMLTDFKENLDDKVFYDALTDMRMNVAKFVEAAKEDLRHSPIHAHSGVIEEWLRRLEQELTAKHFSWVVAAKRWINVAFLGAGNAEANEPIDFRIHSLIAEAHRNLGEWEEAVNQLSLASSLSPNDLVVLRELGRAQLKLNRAKAAATMEQMSKLDADIFRKDREGIALRCSYFAGADDWAGVDNHLSQADPGLVGSDTYLANWRALAAMMNNGAESSLRHFKQLRDHLEEARSGFWDDCTLVNAYLATGELEKAGELLKKVDFPKRSGAEVASASKYYDEILETFDRTFDWRAAAGL